MKLKKFLDPCHFCIFFLLLWLLSSSAQELTTSLKTLENNQGNSNFQDVAIGSPIVVRPTMVGTYKGVSPSKRLSKDGELVAYARIRITGLPRMENVKKFAHTAYVKIDASSIPSLEFNFPRLEVCFHRNKSLALGGCPNENWQALDKGLWTGAMSPFETKFVDIRQLGSNTDASINVSMQEEQKTYRVVFMVLGTMLLLLAPFVCTWVPFYYSSAMTLGVILVVLILLFQGVKLLPIGRKNSMYIALYGSMVGLGTVMLHYFSDLFSSVLFELGFKDDAISPIATFTCVCIGLVGAGLGYFGVQKLVLSDNGQVDMATAIFVKWAIRVIGGVMLLQTSQDVLFAWMTLVLGSSIAWLVGKWHVENLAFADFLQHFWSDYIITPLTWVFQLVTKQFSRKSCGLFHGQLGFEFSKRHRRRPHKGGKLDLKPDIPGKDALVMLEQVGALSRRLGPAMETSSSGTITSWPKEFYSTYHTAPKFRSALRKEDSYYKATAVTNRALDALVHSAHFQEWWAVTVVANNRFSILPNELRQERSEGEIERTAYMAPDDYCSGKYLEFRKGVAVTGHTC